MRPPQKKRGGKACLSSRPCNRCIRLGRDCQEAEESLSSSIGGYSSDDIILSSPSRGGSSPISDLIVVDSGSELDPFRIPPANTGWFSESFSQSTEYVSRVTREVGVAAPPQVLDDPLEKEKQKVFDSLKKMFLSRGYSKSEREANVHLKGILDLYSERLLKVNKEEMNIRLEQQKKIIDSSPIPCMLMNVVHKPIHANRPFYEMIGLPYPVEDMSIADFCALFDYNTNMISWTNYSTEKDIMVPCGVRIHKTTDLRTTYKFGMTFLEGVSWHHREMTEHNFPYCTSLYFMPSAQSITRVFLVVQVVQHHVQFVLISHRAINCAKASVAWLSAQIFTLPLWKKHQFTTANMTEYEAAQWQMAVSFYNLTSGWGTNTSVCDWFGVSCDYGPDGNLSVTALRLNNNGLKGKIDSTFAGLTRLNYLDLHGNSLEGNITVLSQLDQLSYIDISHNAFGRTMPDFSLLLNLSTLNISDNLFAGSLQPLPLSLTVFSFQNNRFNGSFLDSYQYLNFTEIYGQNNLLTAMDVLLKWSALQRCNFSGNDFFCPTRTWLLSLCSVTCDDSGTALVYNTPIPTSQAVSSTGNTTVQVISSTGSGRIICKIRANSGAFQSSRPINITARPIDVTILPSIVLPGRNVSNISQIVSAVVNISTNLPATINTNVTISFLSFANLTVGTIGCLAYINGTTWVCQSNITVMMDGPNVWYTGVTNHFTPFAILSARAPYVPPAVVTQKFIGFLAAVITGLGLFLRWREKRDKKRKEGDIELQQSIAKASYQQADPQMQRL
ncbi:hypothetical protein PROFUN_08936 [Planoprotostelium fungivorum]|uniref:Leucine-rich repeat-containing N-terminal plant-type domain-containing protein n=1 Tax=Planoprotostelium fungivorum TaxID=1890364 RepID=A0A2P6NIQ5_9EUKA|nr:hypothetical protein PROFUN_08936 [Planoprotostelium fungivorum]